MTEPPYEPPAGNDPQPMSGPVQANHMSARVPAEVGTGTFSNGVIILCGAHDVVLDFCLRMGGQQRIVSRVILAHAVAKQFYAALQENTRIYEKRFGGLPAFPQPQRPEPAGAESAPPQNGPADHPENQPQPAAAPPHVEDIYHDLKLSDSVLSGRYANAVLIRHSATEFCFDFITNFYPQSAVSARVYIAAPHLGPFQKSLQRSLFPPASGQTDETVFGG